MKTEQTWEICRNKLAADQSRRELFEAYGRTPSIELRNRLAIANDRLACREAHRQKKVCGVAYEDLEQYARIGLLKAVERYDPTKGIAFSSFAVPYIKGEIQHFLRDHSWDMGKVPRRAIEAASQVKRTKRWAIAAGRVDVKDQQVALSLGIPGAKWRQVAEITARKPVVELDDVCQVPDANDDEILLHQDVRTAVAKLPNPYRRAILEHYFKGLSQAAIAQQHQVEPAQVQLWLEEGLRRLQSGSLASRRMG